MKETILEVVLMTAQKLNKLNILNDEKLKEFEKLCSSKEKEEENNNDTRI